MPLLVKLLYTAFMAVLVPKYWIDYGPTNFLYFCDVALFMTLAALWLENSLLGSAPLVGILVPQIVWMVDFLAGVFDYTITGMTAYMFDPGIPLFTRGLSFFHFWLPLFLIWLVWRLGYDRRAFVVWTALAIIVLLVCYFVMPAPPPPTDNKNLPVNINYVHGLSDDAAQTWMPPLAWLVMLIVGLPLFAYLPTHFLLKWVFPDPQATV
ncbi:MAG: hypothetical protein L0215_18980 [Gemmataceae bacterium]|nr:hypothetical protein [Gemmataceae bacterium]